MRKWLVMALPAIVLALGGVMQSAAGSSSGALAAGLAARPAATPRAISSPPLPAARSGCLYAEDGRCVPLPVPAQQEGGSPEQRSGARREPATARVAPDRTILVKRKASVSAAGFGQMLATRGIEGAEGLLLPRWWRVPVRAGETAAEAKVRLMAMPEVETVEDNGAVYALTYPNDLEYSSQWGPPKIQAPQAWGLGGGGSRSVLIAVIDTGVDYSHPDRPYYLLIGPNLVDDTADPMDLHGHGTHVIGVAGSRTNNGEGIAGICYYCEVLAVKVLDDYGYGSIDDVADGIQASALLGKNAGKRTIINLSLGGSYSSALADAISYAQAQGALVVAASGNFGPGPIGFPASLPGVLAVSATNSSDGPASFSNFYSTQNGDIGAPGFDVYSTIPGGRYDSKSGTSMAAPHVAGAAGLVWSRFPSFSAAQVVSAVVDNVDVPAGWNANYGTGRLNVYKALSALPLSNSVNLSGLVKNN